MKKITNLINLFLALSFFSTAFAAFSAEADVCISQDEINMYCPDSALLTFNPITPSNPNSKGTVAATNFSGLAFKNIDTGAGLWVTAPASIINNHIGNVTYRAVSYPDQTCYGRAVNNTINCFYTYPNKFGSNIALVLQSQ